MVTPSFYSCRGGVDDVGWWLMKMCRHFRKPDRVAAALMCVDPKTVAAQMNEVTPPSQRVSQRGMPSNHEARKIRQRTDLILKLASLTTYKVGSGRYGSGESTRIIVTKLYGSLSDIVRGMSQLYSIEVSTSTIRRTLLSAGWRCEKLKLGPRRHDGDAEKRVAFAKLALERYRWRFIMFSDEKMFDLNDQGVIFVWLAPGEEQEPRGSDPYAPKVHVWAVIGYNYRKIVVLPMGQARNGNICRTQNRSTCQTNCIDPNLKMLKRKGFFFQQDNAACHKASAEYIRDQGINLIDWPARSPDLSPIENLWAVLAKNVSKRGPHTASLLEKFVVEEFNALSDEFVNNFVESFEEKCKNVIEREGKILVGPRKKRDRPSDEE